jgi:hypothetical protein
MLRIGVAVLATLPCNAMAERLSLACRAVGKNHITEYSSVNHIIVDTEQKYVDLRIEETMNSAHPRNWRFDNKGKENGVLISVSDILREVTVAAMYSGMPNMLAIDIGKGNVTWVTNPWGLEPSYVRFKCKAQD